MQVRVRMPAPGVYHGERFGPGDTYAAAHSTVDLKADPFVDLDVELGAGDAVQYILDRPATGRPYPPLNVRAIPGDGRVTVRWSACFGADGYRVQRWAPDGSTRIVGFTRTTS